MVRHKDLAKGNTLGYRKTLIELGFFARDRRRSGREDPRKPGRNPPMSTLNDELVSIIKNYARPIPRHLHSDFFEAIDRRLVGLDPGPGIIMRICSELQP